MLLKGIFKKYYKLHTGYYFEKNVVLYEIYIYFFAICTKPHFVQCIEVRGYGV